MQRQKTFNVQRLVLLALVLVGTSGCTEAKGPARPLVDGKTEAVLAGTVDNVASVIPKQVVMDCFEDLNWLPGGHPAYGSCQLAQTVEQVAMGTGKSMQRTVKVRLVTRKHDSDALRVEARKEATRALDVPIGEAWDCPADRVYHEQGFVLMDGITSFELVDNPVYINDYEVQCFPGVVVPPPALPRIGSDFKRCSSAGLPTTEGIGYCFLSAKDGQQKTVVTVRLVIGSHDSEDLRGLLVSKVEEGFSVTNCSVTEFLRWVDVGYEGDKGSVSSFVLDYLVTCDGSSLADTLLTDEDDLWRLDDERERSTQVVVPGPVQIVPE